MRLVWGTVVELVAMREGYQELLVEVDDREIKVQKYIVNEPIDRTRVTKEIKKELGILLKKMPEIRPVIEILIGKKETKELL